MTLVEGDDMQRLWALVVDLSSQLNMNRQQITSLQTQLQNLKAHSVHTNTGFALRRFNVDVAKETFESELERLNVHLAQENNDLRWENKMNERLIKEYEQCLDLVMKKFRAFSHATQTHTLKLTQYYEDLLASNTHDVAAVSLHAQTSLSSTLSNLGTLVRNALREVEGEAPSPPPSMLFHDDGAGEDEAVPGEGSSASASSSSRKRQQSHQQQAHLWPGSGGYTGKAGDAAAQRSDAALEREAELQMLRYENETLKEILDMAEGKGLDVGAGKDKLSLGTPRGGGSGGSASGHGGGGGGVQRKVRTPSMHQQALPQQQQQQQPQLPGIGINQLYPPPPAAGQQQQQQQQPAYSPMAPRSTPQDIPAAPFPSSSISAPLSHPVPPPTPPSGGGGTGGGGVGRIPLHERMQQAADAIRSQGQGQQQQTQQQQHAVTLHASSADEPVSSTSTAAAPSGSSAAPYLIPERASSTTATSQPSIPALSSSSPSTSSTTSISDFGEPAAAAASSSSPSSATQPLASAPAESAPAQSDIRGAAVLPLVETNTTTPATVAGPAAEESEEMQKEAEREAGEDLPVVEPELSKHELDAAGGEVQAAAASAPLDLDVEKEVAGGEVEAEPPAEHDVDLSDAAEDEKQTSAATHEATVEDDHDAQPEEQAGTSEVVPAVLPASETGSAPSASEREEAGGEEAAMTAAMEPAAAAAAEETSSGGDEAEGAEEGQSS